MAKLKRKSRRRGGEGPTSPRRLAAKERATRALELRKSGRSYAAIADELGYNSPQASWKAVSDLLAATIQEPAKELRTLEVERLDALFDVAYPMALALLKQPAPDEKIRMQAMDRCLRIMERRARLLGLDAPMIFDWRREAKEKGLPATEQFEQMVGMFYDQQRAAEK
ncbi:MAG TPA: hypothetical protein VJK02_21135 [Anaerolineales bacterium]|nr:hypothetical protein [Anaerolineales bacterium]